MSGGKRRGSGEGSIYRRASDGRWVGALSLGFDGGKRVRRTVYGRTRAEVRAQLAELQVEHDRGYLPARRDRPTLAQYLTRWLERRRRTPVAISTYAAYESLARNHILPYLGHFRLDQLRPHHIEDWLGVLGSTPRQPSAGRQRPVTTAGIPISPGTIRQVRTLLRSVLKAALDVELVSRNVADASRPPKREPTRRYRLTAEQVGRFLHATARQSERLYPLAVLAVTTGLRQGELLALRWQEDVDLEHGVISVTRTVQRAGGVVRIAEQPKSHAGERGQPLPALARAVLGQHRDRQQLQRRRAGSAWREHGLVFPTTIGTLWRPTDVIRAFRQLIATINAAARAAGEPELPPITLHDLRRTYSTLLAEQGVHPRDMQQALGHASPHLTLAVYTQASARWDRRVADAIDQALGADPDATETG